VIVFHYGFRLLLLVVAATQRGATRIVEQRKVIVSGSDHGDSEGFLTFPWWRAKRYSSGLLVAYGSPSCVGYAALDCRLGV
jgi:hypothetical protein